MSVANKACHVVEERTVRRLIADHLGVPVALVLDTVDFRDLGADSLDLVSLTMALEEAFDIAIPVDEAENCRRVDDALRLVRQSATSKHYGISPPSEQMSAWE